MHLDPVTEAGPPRITVLRSPTWWVFRGAAGGIPPWVPWRVREIKVGGGGWPYRSGARDDRVREIQALIAARRHPIALSVGAMRAKEVADRVRRRTDTTLVAEHVDDRARW